MAQPHWREGGAVNAIEKMAVVLDGVRRCARSGAAGPTSGIPTSRPADIVPAMVSGGEWVGHLPRLLHARACELMYLPANADADGWGTAGRGRGDEWSSRRGAADPWLAEHPPADRLGPRHPARTRSTPALRSSRRCSRPASAVGEPSRLGGLDSWFDAATFTRFGGTPCVGWGPRGIAWAHTVDEYVPVDDLVRCAQGLALAAMRHCGVAE